MSDPDPAAIPAAVVSPDPTPVPDPEPPQIVLRVATTDHLSQARLEEIATQCLVAFEPVEGGGGIDITVRDQDDAKFWAKRAQFWAAQAEAVA